MQDDKKSGAAGEKKAAKKSAETPAPEGAQENPVSEAPAAPTEPQIAELVALGLTRDQAIEILNRPQD
jgi:hypothetical protein